MHDHNHFITLTYDNNHVPEDHSLSKEAWQNFAKRLRRHHPFRFMMCGEYGEQTSRPHYHAIVFGLPLHDLERLTPTLSTSKTLEKAWPFGHSSVGSVTFESAAYVARYVTKKVTGHLAEQHYQGRQPEFALMSRRPGIGGSWAERYLTDYRTSGKVVMRGREMTIPRYYQKFLTKEEIDAIKENAVRPDNKDNTLDRLEVREKCKIAQLNQLERKL